MGEIVYTIDPVMRAVEARFNLDYNIQKLTTIMVQYQSNATGITIRRGRAKLQDAYPCIALEVARKSEPLAAGNYTKEITINLDIFVMIKTPGGVSTTTKPSLAMEHYIIAMAETAQGILNERGNLTYNNIDGLGMNVYDSYAQEVEYGYLYGGAVRIAKMNWFGKLWLFGNVSGTFST